MGAAPMIAALALTARLHALEQDPTGSGMPPEEVRCAQTGHGVL